MVTLALAVALAAEGPQVGVVSPGAPELAVKAASTPGLPVVLTVLTQPSPVSPEQQLSTDAVVAARTAWVSADFARCLALLENDELVTRALREGQRTLAARTLAWRAACRTSARQTDGARRDAEWLGTLQLPLPDDVGVMTPEIEGLLTQVRRQLDARPLVALSVTSPVRDASVALDGRPTVCTVPCTMSVAPGVHVISLSADGYTPQARSVTIASPGATVDVALPLADPALAASQWLERRAKGASFDDGRAVSVLSVALRSARLVVLGAGEQPSLVRGALAIDGVVQARGERDDVQALVQDLLVRAKIVEPSVPVWKRWPFWVAVGAAVVASGVTTAVLLVNRPISTRVVIRP
jgi:hypothetical protein